MLGHSRMWRRFVAHRRRTSGDPLDRKKTAALGEVADQTEYGVRCASMASSPRFLGPGMIIEYLRSCGLTARRPYKPLRRCRPRGFFIALDARFSNRGSPSAKPLAVEMEITV